MRLSQTVRSWFAIRRRRRHDVMLHHRRGGPERRPILSAGWTEKQVVISPVLWLAGAAAWR